MIPRSQVPSDLLLCHPQCEVSTLRSMVVAAAMFSLQPAGWKEVGGEKQDPSLRVHHRDVVPPIDQNLVTGSYLLQGSLGEVVLTPRSHVPTD